MGLPTIPRALEQRSCFRAAETTEGKVFYFFLERGCGLRDAIYVAEIIIEEKAIDGELTAVADVLEDVFT